MRSTETRARPDPLWFALSVGLCASVVLITAISAKRLLAIRLYVQGIPVNALDAALVLIAVTLVLFAIRERRLTAPWPERVMTLFAIGSIVPLAVGIILRNGGYEIAQDLRMPVFMLLAFLAARVLMRSQRGWMLISLALGAGVLTGSITEIATLLLNIGTVNPLFMESGFFANARDPSLYANIFACGFFILAGLWRESPANQTRRVAQGLVLAVILVGIVASLTRNVWISLLAGSMVYVSLERNRRLFLVVAGVSAVAAVLLAVVLVAFVPAFRGGLESAVLRPLRGDDVSVTGRLEEIQAVNEKIADRPLLGAGFGATINSQAQVARVDTVNVHNSYWWLLLKGGFLYLSLWLLMAAVFVRKAWRVPQSSAPAAWTRASLLTSLAVIFVGAIAGGTITQPAHEVFNGILFAAVSSRSI